MNTKIIELGFPEVLGHVHDTIHQGLADTDAKEAARFTMAFLETAAEGADLSLVWPHFAVWLLTDGVFADGDVAKVVNRVVELHRRLIGGDPPPVEEWMEASVAAIKVSRATLPDRVASALAAMASLAAMVESEVVDANLAAALAPDEAAYARCEECAMPESQFWQACAAKLLKLMRLEEE